MVSGSVKIHSTDGLHLRPATDLCNAAVRHDCRVTLKKENFTGNAKSVLSVLAAMVRDGEEITFECDGSDENEALADVLAACEKINAENRKR